MKVLGQLGLAITDERFFEQSVLRWIDAVIEGRHWVEKTKQWECSSEATFCGANELSS